MQHDGDVEQPQPEPYLSVRLLLGPSNIGETGYRLADRRAAFHFGQRLAITWLLEFVGGPAETVGTLAWFQDNQVAQ